ncbi:MAG TPA: Hsp20/alpha crystallin family protein, partial [Candidatus Hydrogenedentes bacterium]|nr:Hsp20/alpha crystallin family protein [Candidatus Hydrogenedentota bacterium]
NERVHALVGQAADQEASGDRDQTTPRSHAKPEGREAEDPDDTRIGPRRPFYMRPFDPHTWDPFQEMSEMRKRIDALFEDAFGRFGKSARFGDLATEFSFEPTMDVKEEDGRYVIRLDVPGADVTDLKASIENNTLTIEGTRKQEKEESRRGEYLRQERRIGTFRRSFPLPGPVAPESLDTSYKDGVFTITVEKAGATQDNSESGS